MQEVLETKPDERQDPDDSDAFSFDGDSTYDSDGDVTNPYEMTEDGVCYPVQLRKRRSC